MSPVIAGLEDKTNAPYICGMDTIGAIETARDFMVAGTAPDSLYGMCESMWRENMVRRFFVPCSPLFFLFELSLVFHTCLTACGVHMR